MASSICSDGSDGDSLKSGKLQVPKQKRQRPTSTPWTSLPQPLRHRFPVQWWWDFTVDVIMVLLTMPFFILLATVLYVNGKPVGEEQHLGTIEQAVKGAATIFPIAFAAVTGRAAVKFATWKLERGTSLGLLEQLMNSRTVASAAMAPLQLRSFNLVSLGLISLWCMSPLGSQSVLHIFSAPIVAVPTPRHITYYNLRQQSLGSPGSDFDSDFFNGYSMVFGASLLAPTSVKGGSMDLWGNPRIPYFSSVQSSGVKPDTDGWIQIPQQGDFSPVYSSLFGLPLQNMVFGNTTINVESSYIEMACNNISTTPMSKSSSGKIQLTDQISPTGPFMSYRPVNLQAIWAIGYQGPDARSYFANTTTMFVNPQNCPDCLPGNITVSSVNAGTLLYQEFYDISNTTSVYCVPSQVYVESTILCQKTSNGQFCQVIAQRPSQLPHQPSEITYLSFPDIAMGLTNSLYNSTLQISAQNPIQGFLYNSFSNSEIFLEPSSTSQYLPNGDEIPFDSPLYHMSLEDFGNNLGQLVNAWIHGSFYNSTLIMTGANFTDLYQMALDGNAPSFVPASRADLTSLIQNQTSAFTVIANATADVHIYYCDFGWTSIFFLATSAMLCSAILGVVFGRMTVVPDYLGYVSSLAKESQYMKIKDGGANLDGMERSRGIKGLQVRLGNVDEGTGEVGRLAFGRVEDTKPVQRNRLYI
ncbi:hypothetical protein N431DRAFT_423284 [Stipitochalara longipes BDJ]|nr:hypothetical protein N431DRAFT_423284 [Stipitochalara longipes BDJ]